MTRYDVLANGLSNMLHEQLGTYENKLLLLEPADILDNSYEYVIKSNLVSTIDIMLDNQQINEDEIVALFNSSLDELYDFYGQGSDIDAINSYFKCITDFCFEVEEN